MKKLLLLVSCTLMMACSNDEFSIKHSENSLNEISTVMVRGENVYEMGTRAILDDTQPALRFKDNNALLRFEAKLNDLSDDEKIAIVSKYGISTLHDIAKAADEELELLGQSASSEEEFRELYAKYKQKYDGILISNDIDKSDLTLYVPEEDNVKSYISNVNQIYVVGDKVVKANLNDNLSESMVRLSSTTTTASTLPINTSVYSPKSGKKVYFDAYMVGIRMWVKMHCKKKMWYGWKNDPAREYFFDSHVNNFVYLGKGQYGQEVETPRLPRYIFNNNVKEGFNIILGRSSSNANITGEIYTWTDMTSEHDADGKDITEKLDGYIVPKCLKSKAHIIMINLKPQV